MYDIKIKMFNFVGCLICLICLFSDSLAIYLHVLTLTLHKIGIKSCNFMLSYKINYGN